MDKQTDVTCKFKMSEISETYNGMTRACFDNDSYGRAIQLAVKEQRASQEDKEALHKIKPTLSKSRRILKYQQEVFSIII